MKTFEQYLVETTQENDMMPFRQFLTEPQSDDDAEESKWFKVCDDLMTALNGKILNLMKAHKPVPAKIFDATIKQLVKKVPEDIAGDFLEGAFSLDIESDSWGADFFEDIEGVADWVVDAKTPEEAWKKIGCEYEWDEDREALVPVK